MEAQGFDMVVKIRVPFWVPIIIRHLLFRVPKKANFDNYPYEGLEVLSSGSGAWNFGFRVYYRLRHMA